MNAEYIFILEFQFIKSYMLESVLHYNVSALWKKALPEYKW